MDIVLREVVSIVQDCEDFKGRGYSRNREEQQELLAYHRIKELISDLLDKKER